MPFVFISHASDDKPRIAPLVVQLQRAGLRIWFDRPDEISPNFQADGSIEVGDNWRTSIDDALGECGCVLVFWSKHTTRDRSVLQDEAATGLEEKKLIQVFLDPGLHAQIDRIYTRHQGVELFKAVDGKASDAAIQRIVDAIQRKIESHKYRADVDGPARKRSQDIPRALRPYIVDRHSQINRARSAISGLIAKFPRDHPPAAGARPAFVVLGKDIDCPERLTERLQHVDGPALCVGKDQPHWGEWNDDIGLDWPTNKSAKPATVHSLVAHVLEGNAGAFDRPGCVVATIKSLRSNEASFVEAWLSAWDQAFRDAPATVALPVLIVDRKAVENGWFMRSGKSKFGKIERVVERWSSDHPGTWVAPILLEPLSLVSRTDAKSWAKICFGLADARRDAENFIRTRFARDGIQLSLAAFADEVEKCDWFRALKG